MSDTFRPQKLAGFNRAEFIYETSEVSLRCINDASGNPVYLAKARVGSSEDDEKWQLRKVSYDASGAPLKIEWAEDESGHATNCYIHSYLGSHQADVTTIVQSNPAVVVSEGHGFSDGDKVVLEDVEGMTELNFSNLSSKVFTVANAAADNFELSGVNSTGYGAYTGGGVIKAADFAEKTYS